MFHKCKNDEEKKKLFRRLSKLLHPDAGGDSELFVLLEEHYRASISKGGWKEVNGANKIYDGDKRLQIFLDIVNLCETHKLKVPKYVVSVLNFLEDAGFITIKQFEGLMRTLENLEKK